jgi:Zn-dependent peptidase ImmA (M78 family)
MEEFNPSRLAVARKRRGFSKNDLSRSADLSLRSLTTYENGTQRPTALTVARLAGALGFPVGFFTGPDLDQPPEGGASYRALTRMTARQQGQAEASATLAMMLSDWIDARFNLPVPDDFPQYRVADPEAAAEAVRAEWGLGDRPVRNMIHLLEKHGVRVFSLAEETAEMDAFSFWRGGRLPYVFLNTQKTAEHNRMDAAHELGHLVLHGGHEAPRGREAEHQANLFGSAFLMPHGSVLAEAPPAAGLRQIIQIKRKWRVSVAALVYRMHRLGLLTDWQYRALFIELGKRGYRTNEPNGIERETSQILAKVFDSLRDQGLSKADVARELHIPIAELNKSVFGLVLTQIEGGRDDSEPQQAANLTLLEG